MSSGAQNINPKKGQLYILYFSTLDIKFNEVLKLGNLEIENLYQIPSRSSASFHSQIILFMFSDI